MLGFKEKNKAEKKLKKAINKYEKVTDELNSVGEKVHETKSQDAVGLITEIEQYLEQLSGVPKEFEKNINSFESVKLNYVKEYQDLRKEHDFDPVKHIGKGSGALAAGALASFGPTALMSIATTFGTASTGTAISTLSGAAATNAAAAWLGGGAVAAGGGGMGVGGAVLAATGPVGWGAAGVLMLGCAVKTSNDNSQAVTKYTNETVKILKTNSDLTCMISEFKSTLERLTQEISYCRQILSELRLEAPGSYDNFTIDNKKLLGNLINHVQIITALMK